MKKFVFIALMALSAVACSDFLEEIPEDRITEENFYKTLEDAQAAVDAIYQPIRVVSVFGGQYLLQVEIMAEFSIGRGSTAAVGAYQGLDATNAQRVGLVWQYLYQSILYANTAIERISEMTDVNETAKERLLAEARFMRAFSYYHLVRHWGAVPLILSTTQGHTARTPVDEVYASIIVDLEVGESVLPDVPAQFGRPTKWASKAFLADVYLTRGEWALAQQKAEEVISANKFGLVTVAQLNDWDRIFGAGANGTSEEIFYLKYNHLNGTQWPHNLLYQGTPYSPFGNYVMTSSLDNKFLNEWNDNDWRKQWGVFTHYTDPTTGQDVQLPGLAPVQFSKFRDPNAPTSSGHANDYPFLRYADVLLIQAEASAMAEGGPSATAIELLNRIKRRGYGYPIDTPSPVDYPSSGWTASSFQDSVLQERAYELFLEGKRWLDLKRTNKINASILKYTGITVADAHINWPIPQQEIDTNPEINQADQNPGY
ncbi:Starch-binding associating with outer membrane [Parapedobacter luteus]|uniref:Starch-binding associating with outer membrane n=1 Tax=Parapedobacter luteus TaxID=623280 RepID=A0A1T5D8K7_9SPHI|nr:RagB/SusD family nutrient uptake outer membrane protein [Parapedobacter luteus]SKB68034.1 Starch-binding associating with outer membrane [Parapedobacter luteus]